MSPARPGTARNCNASGPRTDNVHEAGQTKSTRTFTWITRHTQLRALDDKLAALYAGEVTFLDSQLGRLFDELERRDLSTGLIAMCTGGGMGTATIIERI